MIQVDDLSKSYGAVAALRAVTFEIENGEIVRLLGRNYVVTSSASRFYALVSAYDVGRLVESARDDFLSPPPAPATAQPQTEQP